MSYRNYKPLEVILSPLISDNVSGVLGWGGGHGNLKHNTEIFNCPHCRKDATTTECIVGRKHTVVGFRKQSVAGRSFIVGFLIIKCPHCDEKYTIHTGSPTIAALIDVGVWPLSGLKRDLHEVYLAVFPNAPK